MPQNFFEAIPPFPARIDGKVFMTKRLLFVIATLAGCLCRADEGMWPVNQFPKQAVLKSYGFEVSDDFLGHIQRSSVRFNSGGSGSFISPQGLLFTNHHVGRDCIQKVSSADHDYVANGFYAASTADEKKCPDLEVNILLVIEEVTAKVKEGEKPDADTAVVNQARKAAMARNAARAGFRKLPPKPWPIPWHHFSTGESAMCGIG